MSVTGKSRLCEYILHLLHSHHEDPQFFDIDEVREEIWGLRAKALTAAEHRFKNELTRNEVKKAFVLGAQTVLLNMVMPTERFHQRPFMEMVHDTERILTEIETDCGQPVERVKIEIRAIWCDCDEATARRRLAERAKGNHISDLSDIKVWLNNKSWFEPPDGKHYPFVRLDTSDVSPDAEQGRLRTVDEFLFG